MSPAVPRLTVVACCLCLLLAALGAGAVADAPTRPEHAEPHHDPARSLAPAPSHTDTGDTTTETGSDGDSTDSGDG
jgi:hypothetical protein